MLSTAKRYPGNIQLVGDTIETMDKTVGRIVYRSKGDVSSKNYLSITNLDLAGPIFVFQLSLIEPLISTIHIEVMTSLQLPLRITLSTLYGKDPPTFLGRSMRLPLPPIYSWMNLVINVGDILEQYCRYDRGQTQMRLGRIKKIDVCSNTVIRDIVSVGSYSEAVQLKVLQVKPGVDVPMIMFDKFCKQFRPTTSSQQRPSEVISPSKLANAVQDGTPGKQEGLKSPNVTFSDTVPANPTSNVAPWAGQVDSFYVANNNSNDILSNSTELLSPPPARSPTSIDPPLLSLRPVDDTADSNQIHLRSNIIEQRIEQNEDVVIAADDEDFGNRHLTFSDFQVKDDRALVDESVEEAKLAAQQESHRILQEEEDRQKRIEAGEMTEEDTAETEAPATNADVDRPQPLKMSESVYRNPSELRVPPPNPVAGAEIKLQTNERLISMDLVMGYLSGPAALLYNSRMLVHSLGSFLIVTDLDRNSINEGSEKPSFGLWKVFTSFAGLQTFSSDTMTAPSHSETPAATPLPPINGHTGLRQTLLKGHANDVGLIEVSRNDTWMITAESGVDRDGLLILWDLKNGSRIASLRPHPGRILAVAINQAETQIATAGLDHKNRYQIIVWDISKLSQCHGTVIGHQLSATSKDPSNILAYSAIVAKQISDFDITKLKFNRFDDTQLVSCGRENIRIWRMHRNHLPARPVLLNAYARNVQYTDITYDVSGKSIFVASDRGHVLKIQHPSLQVVAAYKLHESGINCIHVQNACCITGGQDHLLRVWPLDFNDFLLEARHEGSITCLAMQEDKGHRLVIGTNAGTLGILDLPHHRYETMVRSHHESVTQILERRGNDTMVTVGSDNTVRVWNASGQQVVEFWSESDAPTSICDLNFSANQLLAGFESGFIRVFDIATAVCSMERKYCNVPITSLLVSTYMGRWVIVGYADGVLHVLDYNDHLRLMYEYQSPLFAASANSTNNTQVAKLKLSLSGDVLIHEFGGKITVFDVPHLRILLDSFEVWSKKPNSSASTSSNQVVLGIEVIEKFYRQFLLVIGERLCKLYSFCVFRAEDVSEIRVLLHSSMSFSGPHCENNSNNNSSTSNRVKVLPDIALIAFLYKPNASGSGGGALEKSNGTSTKDCFMMVSKFEIRQVDSKTDCSKSLALESTTTGPGSQDIALNEQEHFSIVITKPQPQSIVNSTVFDVAWSAARRQLVTTTAAGYLAFWRVHSYIFPSHFQRRSTGATNYFGAASNSAVSTNYGGGLHSPMTPSPFPRANLETAKPPTRQLIDTQGPNDVVRVSLIDDHNDEGFAFHGQRLRDEDLLEAEDHHSLVSHAIIAAEKGNDADEPLDDGPLDETETKILDVSGLIRDAAHSEGANYDALWQDDFVNTQKSADTGAKNDNDNARAKSKKRASSKLNSSFSTTYSNRSTSRKEIGEPSASALPEGVYVQGDCFHPILSDSSKSTSLQRGNALEESAPPSVAAGPPLSSLFEHIEKNCLVWNEDFAMISDAESISLCLFVTGQRIVLTKADIPMPFTIRRVWQLYMAPLHSHIDSFTHATVHTHSVLLVVSDIFDYVHRILWSWSHIGGDAAPPVATLPQCISLDAIIPPVPASHRDGSSSTEIDPNQMLIGLGQMVWLSEQRFAYVAVKELSVSPVKGAPHVNPAALSRDQLITLQVSVFHYSAPHATESGSTLSVPAATLIRQQLLEIPGHTLFGVRNIPMTNKDGKQDYIVFSTGYCCVMMELPHVPTAAHASALPIEPPKVWLNDVKNRGNFLAMTARGIRSKQASSAANFSSTSLTFAIVAAVNHAAELHITLFQQPPRSQVLGNGSSFNATKLLGRSTVCSFPSVNHLGVDPTHPDHQHHNSHGHSNPGMFVTIELLDSPVHKQHRQQAAKLAYQLFLVEHNVVRLYDMVVSETGSKQTSIRATLHGLRKISLDFLPCQVFAHGVCFANNTGSKGKLVLLGSKGQLAYLQETRLSGDGPTSKEAVEGAMTSSSNAGVVLQSVGLAAAVPASRSLIKEKATAQPSPLVVRTLSNNSPLVYVPQTKANDIDGLFIYSLSNGYKWNSFDPFVLRLRLAPGIPTNSSSAAAGGGADSIYRADSVQLCSHSHRQSVSALARPGESYVNFLVATSSELLHVKPLRLFTVNPFLYSSGSLPDVDAKDASQQKLLKRSIITTASIATRPKSDTNKLTDVNSKKTSSSLSKRPASGPTATLKTASRLPKGNSSNESCRVLQLALLSDCDPNLLRTATMTVVFNEGNSKEDTVGVAEISCDAREDTSGSAVALKLLPLPYNPRRPYFYDGNRDDEGSVSSDDACKPDPHHGFNSATSALLNTRNLQQQSSLLLTCETEHDGVPAAVFGVLRKETAVLELYQRKNGHQQWDLGGLHRLCVAVSADAVRDAAHSAYFPVAPSQIVQHYTVPVIAEQLQLLPLTPQQGAFQESNDEDSTDRLNRLRVHQQHQQALLCVLGRMNLQASSAASVSTVDSYGNTLSLFVTVVAYRFQPSAAEKDSSEDEIDEEEEEERTMPPVQLTSAVMLQRLLVGDSLLHISFCNQFVALLHPHALYIVDLRQFATVPEFHHHYHQDQQKHTLTQETAPSNAYSSNFGDLLKSGINVINVERAACKTLTPSQITLCDGDWSKGVSVTLWCESVDDQEYSVLFHFAGLRMDRVFLGKLH